MSEAAVNQAANPQAKWRLPLKWATPLGIVALVIAVALVPQMTTRQDTLNLLFLIFLYITLGQSWNVLAGFTGQINLGHAAFFGIGALVTRTLWTDRA